MSSRFPNSGRGATLRDVARHAGVSVATVSRVASGSGPVKSTTRARVERAMRELFYVPPARPRTSTTVGLLVPELANPIFPALAQAIENKATEAGLASILCNTEGSVDEEVAYAQMLLSRQVDGMIFIAAAATDLRHEYRHYGSLIEQGARLVFVNGDAPSIDAASVGVDERAAGELATRHLLELGHSRIGFVAGPAYSRPTRNKAAGRETALAAAGIDVLELVVHAEWGVQGGSAAMRALLELGPGRRPTAVICSSDLMAIGALRAAKEAGLACPGDLSIVGFDGIDGTVWTEPRLTTLAQPIEQIASATISAVRMLFDQPAGPLPHVTFRPHLIERESTAPPRRR